MADINFRGRGAVRDQPPPEDLTEEQRAQLRAQWMKDHPFAPSSSMPRWLEEGATPTPSATRAAADYVPTDTPSARRKGEAQTPRYEPSPLNLPKASKYVMDALRKRPEERTPQETAAINNRKRAEEITLKGGNAVQDGILSTVDAEEKAGQEGARDATTAIGYYQGRTKAFADRGFGPDGTPLPANAPASAAAPVASGATGAAPAASGTPAAPAAPKPTGFAMRTMPDGTVRTASGFDANGSSVMRDFGTKEEALAYFRPVVGPDGKPVVAGSKPAQPNQPAAPAPMAQPAAPAAQVAAPAPAPVPAQPAPVAQATPAAAPATTPTLDPQQAKKANKVPDTFGESRKPLEPANSPRSLAGPSIDRALTKLAGFMTNPGDPSQFMDRLLNGEKAPASAKMELPSAPGLMQPKNPFAERTTAPATRVKMTTREMGIPGRRGFQTQMSELNPYV